MYVSVPNQDLDLKRLISWSFCARWVQLRWEIIVRFIDILIGLIHFNLSKTKFWTSLRHILGEKINQSDYTCVYYAELQILHGIQGCCKWGRVLILNFIHTIFILCDTEEKAYYILFLQYNLSVAIIIILEGRFGTIKLA
jgi:hypothetical protein